MARAPAERKQTLSVDIGGYRNRWITIRVPHCQDSRTPFNTTNVQVLNGQRTNQVNLLKARLLVLNHEPKYNRCRMMSVRNLRGFLQRDGDFL